MKQYTKKGGPQSVVFMIASVLRDRRNIVEKEAIAKLVEYIGFGHSPIQRNWIPGILVKTLKLPANYKFVEMGGTCRNLLYTLESPNFEIKSYAPLQFTAIGSGQSCLEQIERYQDAVFALFPGNSFMEGSQFRQVIQNFIYEKGIKSVGGLSPVLKVTGSGIEHIGMSTEIPVGGTKIELSFSNGQWTQRNLTTGKELPIVFPWEFMKTKGSNSQTFNDLNIAMKQFRDGH